MKCKLNYIGSLVGRTFIMSSSKNIKSWNGVSGEDYDNLIQSDSIDDEEPTLYKKDELRYLLYFSMSTKVEIFQSDNSIVICNGLLFDTSLKNLKILGIKKINNLDVQFEIDSELLIMDAAIDGSWRKEDKDLNDKFAYVEIPRSKKCNYLLEIIELIIIHDNEEIVLDGFRLLPISPNLHL